MYTTLDVLIGKIGGNLSENIENNTKINIVHEHAFSCIICNNRHVNILHPGSTGGALYKLILSTHLPVDTIIAPSR